MIAMRLLIRTKLEREIRLEAMRMLGQKYSQSKDLESVDCAGNCGRNFNEYMYGLEYKPTFELHNLNLILIQLVMNCFRQLHLT